MNNGEQRKCCHTRLSRETLGQGAAPISFDTGWCHTTSDCGAGMGKAISVIKILFHSCDRQQPAGDLPPCRCADSRRHRTRSHYLKGTRAQQVVDVIGIYCCEPGTVSPQFPRRTNPRAHGSLQPTSEATAGTRWRRIGRIQRLFHAFYRRSIIESVSLWSVRAASW